MVSRTAASTISGNASVSSSGHCRITCSRMRRRAANTGAALDEARRIRSGAAEGHERLATRRRAFDAEIQSARRDVDEADRISLIFAGHAMRDDKLFYADHYMLLPAWVQVFVHRCEFDEVAAVARRLQQP